MKVAITLAKSVLAPLGIKLLLQHLMQEFKKKKKKHGSGTTTLII